MPRTLLSVLVILTFAHQNFFIFHEFIKINCKISRTREKKLAYFTSP